MAADRGELSPIRLNVGVGGAPSAIIPSSRERKTKG